jgi:hypothetical protein
LGNFNDPGKDAKRYSPLGKKTKASGKKTKSSGKKRSNTISMKSLELRDDTATSLSVTNPFAVSSYSTLKVEFWYKSLGFNQKSDCFCLQSANGDAGTDWVTKGTWFYGSNIFTNNDKWRFASVKFPIDTTAMRIRFKNNGDNDKEKIYIDDVIVSGN